MQRSLKPFFYGFFLASAIGVTTAIAKQQGLTVLPEQALIINRSNQAIPIYSPEALEIRNSERSALYVRSDKPIKVELSKPAETKWEYRVFASAEDMIDGLNAKSAQDALNKLGDQNWELVERYIFKRIKN